MSLDISDILNDNRSGSFTITTNSLKRYLDYIKEEMATDTSLDVIFENIQDAAKDLVKSP